MNGSKLYRKSNFPTLEQVLIDTYGIREGKDIFHKAGERLAELVQTVDDRGNPALRKHLNKNILPVVAYYQAAQAWGIDKAAAKAFIGNQMHSQMQEHAQTYRRLAKIPFFYPIFRKMIKWVLDKQYPSAGWQMQWRQDNTHGIGFDYHSCFYLDTATSLGCPEMCELFCQNDDINFSAFAPTVIFKRTQTLAACCAYCDFRFLNGKYTSNK